jgi:Membrane carboxypeptidase/penicillin-binding protein
MATNTTLKQSKLSIIGILGGTVRFLGGTLFGLVMVGGSITAGGLLGVALAFRELPDVRVLKGYVPAETSYLYDSNGELIARVHGDVNREVIP